MALAIFCVLLCLCVCVLVCMVTFEVSVLSMSEAMCENIGRCGRLEDQVGGAGTGLVQSNTTKLKRPCFPEVSGKPLTAATASLPLPPKPTVICEPS